MEQATAIYLQSIKALCPDLADEELSLFASKLTTKDLKKKDLFIQAEKVKKK